MVSLTIAAIACWPGARCLPSMADTPDKASPSMNKRIALALLATLAYLPAAPAPAAPKGPADDALAAYMKATKVPCYTQAGEARCTIASLDQGKSVFLDKPGAEATMAVAFVTYQYDSTGNGMDQMAIVMRRDGARWTPVGRADNTVGSSPRDARFAPGSITYVGTVVGERDNRANPRGKATFRLAVGPGGVTFAGKGDAGRSMSDAIRR